MASSQQHRCVFVGNIPYDATEEQLIQICEEVGPVVSFRLVIDRETGKPKGYGFCEYKDEETALSARRNLQGYEINGRQLRVDFAENDKGSDRNRDQGRGGPGMATNVDGQKQIGGPAVIGDSTLHQPIGIPIAMSAASVMAGALVGAQSSQINQNGFQNPVGNDPLTHHLAKMSKSQLNQVMHEMKMLATQNKDVARQLLLGSPQLTKALFQVQIMLGLVTPQMLQMPNIRAQAPNPSPQPSLQLPMQGQQPIAPQTVPGLPPFASLTSVSQSSLPHGQFSTPLPLPPQPRAQLPNLSQIRPPLQSTMPAQSGPPPLTALRPQPMAGPQIPAVSSHSFSPLQPSLVQHGGHPGQLPIPSSSLLPSFQSRPISSDPMYQAASSIWPGLVEANNRDTAKNAQVMGDTALVGRAQGTANLPQVSNKNDSQNLMAHPAKLVKLDDGRAAHFSSAGPTVMESGPSNVVKNSSIGVGQNSITEAQALDKQGPQLQLPPDVESALLQQVLNLTPEQLSSLPPEQQQQVVQLQKMLR